MSGLARLGYSLLLYLLAPLLMVRLWVKGFRLPGYRQRLGERLGHWPPMPEKMLWIHAVSVGETIAARPLVESWLDRHPDIPLLITTMTPTGSQTVRAQFGDRVHHAYLPWDLPHVQRRLVHTLKPRALVIMETELWPNLVRSCHQARVPVLLANARLSRRSAEGYRKLKWLIQPALHALSGIAAQHTPDAERFHSLGVADSRLEVTGSIKFDIKLTPELHTQIEQYRRQLYGRPVWVAASTHPTEEATLLAAHRELRKTLPEALLILVPRHPDRFNAVAELLDRERWRYSRRSRIHRPRKTDAVFLGDTLGELMLFYGAAHAAVVGNSFNQGGGHNPIEPAALAKPVLTGPSFVNFQSIYDAMRSEQAVVVVNDTLELVKRLNGLLKSQDLRDTYGQRAYLFFQHQQGALQRLENWVEKLLALEEGSKGISTEKAIRRISSREG
ncbi:MAG: lipid IV(A) 3-deoxy-D-manno-octulosonic acid transferase [Saccharospirillum sp.]